MDLESPLPSITALGGDTDDSTVMPRRIVYSVSAHAIGRSVESRAGWRRSR